MRFWTKYVNQIIPNVLIEGHIIVRNLWKCRTTLCYICTSTVKYKAYVYVVCGFSYVFY